MTMKKLILAGLAAFMLGTAAMIPQAEARCRVNAYGWHCWHPHAWWRHHHCIIKLIGIIRMSGGIIDRDIAQQPSVPITG
jgi:hypothetical protein